MAESVAVARPKASVLERMLALAKTPEERERAYQLAERHAQSLLVQEITAQLTAQSWGAKVSPALRAETVRWALEVGADPTSEVDILGGKPYLNANYWMRMVSVEPDFLRAEEVWVHHDTRANAEVNTERAELRVKWAVPDEIAATVGLHKDQKAAAQGKPPIKVKAAVLVILHFSGGRGPFVGKKWSPSRANDDVGMDHPEASALTRAWRKAALQAVRRKPTFSHRLTNAMIAQQVASRVPESSTLPGASLTSPDTEGVAALTDGGQPISDDEAVQVTKHNPNAICAKEVEHAITECALEKPKQ